MSTEQNTRELGGRIVVNPENRCTDIPNPSTVNPDVPMLVESQATVVGVDIVETLCRVYQSFRNDLRGMFQNTGPIR